MGLFAYSRSMVAVFFIFANVYQSQFLVCKKYIAHVAIVIICQGALLVHVSISYHVENLKFSSSVLHHVRL